MPSNPFSLFQHPSHTFFYSFPFLKLLLHTFSCSKSRQYIPFILFAYLSISFSFLNTFFSHLCIPFLTYNPLLMPSHPFPVLQHSSHTFRSPFTLSILVSHLSIPFLVLKTTFPCLPIPLHHVISLSLSSLLKPLPMPSHPFPLSQHTSHTLPLGHPRSRGSTWTARCC